MATSIRLPLVETSKPFKVLASLGNFPLVSDQRLAFRHSTPISNLQCVRDLLRVLPSNLSDCLT